MSTTKLSLDPERPARRRMEFQNSLELRKMSGKKRGRRWWTCTRCFRAGLIRPDDGGNCSFGPTGSGKTRIVEAAAEILFGDLEGNQSGLRGVSALA